MPNSNGSSQTNNQSQDITNKDNLHLKVDRLYVKEISCKIPHEPGLFDSIEFKEDKYFIKGI